MKFVLRSTVPAGVVLGLMLASGGAVGLAQAQTVVRIGHVGPVSGPQAHYGRDNENGARMAVEELNAQGVSIGGKKVKFELVAEDDAADPKQGTAAAQKLCDAKVNGVVGHLNSGTTIPAARVYNQCGLPMISPSAFRVTSAPARAYPFSARYDSRAVSNQPEVMKAAGLLGISY